MASQNEEFRSDFSLIEILTIFKHSIKQYSLHIQMAVLFGALEVVGECALPFIMASLLDHIKVNAELTTIATYGVALVAASLVTLVVGTIAGHFSATASTGFAKNIRNDLFNSIQNFSHESINKFSPSSLVTRLTTDTTNMQRVASMFLTLLLRSPLVLTFAMIMAWQMAGKMALIYVAVGPILILALIFITKYALPIFKRIFKRYDHLNLRINENIHGIRTVKSYVREHLEINKFEEATESLYRDYSKAECLISLCMPAMNLSIGIIFVFVIYVGSRMIITTQATEFDVGQFSALITYGFMILFSLLSLAMIFANVTIAHEAANRICQVLIEKPTISNPENPVFEVKNGDVVFKDVCFKYSPIAPEYVLNNITLTIPSGSTVGVIGATGSAKTSLAQLIARLYDVTSGELLVGDVNVKDYDIESLRKNVALVEQKNMLFSGTIIENMRWGNPDATPDEIKQACKISCADEFIKTFPDGYETHIEQGGSNISGGQKQRLCIARALLKHPKVLIFDDSTSAVDTKTDALIGQGLKEYAPETTQIIIAQRISSVQHADMIVVLNRGRISACGTHEELLKTSEFYRETYLAQTHNTEGGE